MRKLTLQANFEGWPAFCRRRNDAAFKPIKEKVLKRDSFTCQFCQFQAKRYQQIINLDSNYRNNSLDNMATSCVLCMQCHFLGSEKFGSIIYLPEYTQLELNHLVRVLFCAMAENVPYRDTARTLYRSFRNRSQQVDELFGENASDSAVFGQCMVDLKKQNTPEAQEVFQKLRLLPFRSPLEKPIAYWATLVASEL